MIASLILIPVMFIAMGGITSAGIQKAVQEAKHSNILVILEDTSPLALEAAKTLEKTGIRIETSTAAKQEAETEPITLVIPKDFTLKLEK